MEKSLNSLLKILIIVVILFLVGLLIYLFYCKCSKDKITNPVYGSESSNELNRGKSVANKVKGAKFPPIDIKCEDANDDKAREVPTGPLRGTLSPTSQGVKLLQIKKNASETPLGGAGDPVVFSNYTPFGTRVNSGGIPPDMSGAQNGDVILMTGNTYAAFSTNAGSTYIALNPSTIFPSAATNDAAGNPLSGGLCCDPICASNR
jgi:hypothetical protein